MLEIGDGVKRDDGPARQTDVWSVRSISRDCTVDPLRCRNFLGALMLALSDKIHTVVVDNGTHGMEPRGNGWTPEDIKAKRTEKVLRRCIIPLEKIWWRVLSWPDDLTTLH